MFVAHFDGHALLLKAADTLRGGLRQAWITCQRRAPAVFLELARGRVEPVEKGHAEPGGIGQGTTDQQFFADQTEVLELLVVKTALTGARRTAHGRAVVMILAVNAGHGGIEPASVNTTVAINELVGRILWSHALPYASMSKRTPE